MIFAGQVTMIKATLLIQSIFNRWLSCLLIILTLSSSISLFFIVTRIQESVKTSFQNTVAGVDNWELQEKQKTKTALIQN